jgi:hypothetical protein
MKEDRTDRDLTALLRKGLSLSQDQEDSLWARFEARRSQDAAAWAAFAAGMAVLSVRLRPALRPAYRPQLLVPEQGGPMQ